MLSHLLAGFAAVDSALDRPIEGIAMDSRRTRPGDLFLACGGGRVRGHDFVADAIAEGAVAVAYEAGGASALAHAEPGGASIPLFSVDRLKENIGIIAERFYRHPSRDLFVIGVTGTNGKTSCSHFLAQALSGEGHRCGIIGTLGNGFYGALAQGTHTTPDAVSLHALLAGIRDGGARDVVMEVSSHGLHQHRVAGVAFDLALFTNLSHEHLDYHGSMAEYGLAKRRLFDSPGLRYAVINADDAYGRELLAALPPGVEALAYRLAAHGGSGLHKHVLASDLRLTSQGLAMHITTPWGEGELHSGLLGRFNASNLLAVLGTLLLMGVELPRALERLAGTCTVPGRMERFGGAAGRPLVVVDYAHTPDALHQVLAALREHCRGVLWCVFGCGGDRDRGKRPVMGEIAARGADRVVLTDDNPRTEAPQQIIDEILAGMAAREPVRIERDRARAIAAAIAQAGAEDVVLIAGKGHEEYQLIGERRLPFSDRAQVRAVLGEAASS